MAIVSTEKHAPSTHNQAIIKSKFIANVLILRSAIYLGCKAKNKNSAVTSSGLRQNFGHGVNLIFRFKGLWVQILLFGR